MKKHFFPLLILNILLISCILTGCSRNEKYGIIFSAMGTNSKGANIYRIQNDQTSVISSTDDTVPFFFRILYIDKDGKNIYAKYYESGTESLYVIENEGPIKNIFTMPQGIGDISISPKGDKVIIFDYTDTFFLGDLIDDNVKNLINIMGVDTLTSENLTWSPDEKQIAIVSSIALSSIKKYNKYATYTEVYTINLSSRQMYKLTDVALGCGYPEWSTSGKWIAVSCRGEADPSQKLILVANDGSVSKTISCEKDNSKAGNPGTYSWSPDGNYLAYICQSTMQSFLYYSLADGSNGRLVPFPSTMNIIDISEVVWTPDSKSLVMLGTDFLNDTPEEKVFLANLDGSYVKVLNEGLSEYHDLHVYENGN
jgi:Tol biopolymer transport system component